ncbi:TPA: IS30 family transposase [Yersinia enterocolitica]
MEKQRGDGVNQATIARELELPRSTISRELRRNTDSAFNGIYSCRRAETLARARRQQALPNNVVNQLDPHIQDFIRQALSTHTSPEVISGRLFLKFGLSVSKDSLYRYIQQERQASGDLYQQFPHRGKQYNYHTDQPPRGPIPNRVGIEQRPAEADLKQQPGHFEIDTIFGKDQKSFLLTVVVKAVKMVIIRKLPNKRAETVVAAFRDIVANTSASLKP